MATGGLALHADPDHVVDGGDGGHQRPGGVGRLPYRRRGPGARRAPPPARHHRLILSGPRLSAAPKRRVRLGSWRSWYWRGSPPAGGEGVPAARLVADPAADFQGSGGGHLAWSVLYLTNPVSIPKLPVDTSLHTSHHQLVTEPCPRCSPASAGLTPSPRRTCGCWAPAGSGAGPRSGQLCGHGLDGARGGAASRRATTTSGATPSVPMARFASATSCGLRPAPADRLA
jgi:hypothetical protein